MLLNDDSNIQRHTNQGGKVETLERTLTYTNTELFTQKKSRNKQCSIFTMLKTASQTTKKRRCQGQTVSAQ